MMLCGSLSLFFEFPVSSHKDNHTVHKRIGFACKFLTTQPFENKKSALCWTKQHNTGSTTVANLEKLGRTKAIDRICEIVEHNASALTRQFMLMATWPQQLRMVRMGSEIMPARTHPSWMDVYDNEPAVKASLSKLGAAGDAARASDIRLSTHPSQFTMLCSNSEDVVRRSLDDLHYHSEIFRLMGYDSSDQRQEINIHGGARRPDFKQQFTTNFSKLASDTQQWLSVENDEFSYCVDDLLDVSNLVKICVDINHYWIHQGSYLQPDDERIDRIVSSWRGARPEMHVAWPRESVLESHDPNMLPCMHQLTLQGHKKGHLRAHSDGAWNMAITDYALGFWSQFDLMVEAKNKNLAAVQLWERGRLTESAQQI
jgi:UV DNA damage endonuclease